MPSQKTKNTQKLKNKRSKKPNIWVEIQKKISELTYRQTKKTDFKNFRLYNESTLVMEIK